MRRNRHVLRASNSEKRKGREQARGERKEERERERGRKEEEEEEEEEGKKKKKKGGRLPLTKHQSPRFGWKWTPNVTKVGGMKEKKKEALSDNFSDNFH